jgi:PIN domain nuclease of toxin-antitoxin system
VRLLLDTHVWLWLQAEPERVDPSVLAQLADRRNDILLSAASAWEIAIKAGLGKLVLPEPATRYVPSRLRASGTTPLSIETAHVLEVGELPPHHRDPFDRLLIAQSRMLSIPIVTDDRVYSRYDVEVIAAH